VASVREMGRRKRRCTSVDGRQREEFLQRPGLSLRLREGGGRNSGPVPVGPQGASRAKVPADLLEAMSLCGPEGYIKERLAAFAEVGVTHLNVTPVGGDPIAMIETLRAGSSQYETAGSFCMSAPPTMVDDPRRCGRSQPFQTDQPPARSPPATTSDRRRAPVVAIGQWVVEQARRVPSGDGSQLVVGQITPRREQDLLGIGHEESACG